MAIDVNILLRTLILHVKLMIESNISPHNQLTIIGEEQRKTELNVENTGSKKWLVG